MKVMVYADLVVGFAKYSMCIILLFIWHFLILQDLWWRVSAGKEMNLGQFSSLFQMYVMLESLIGIFCLFCC